MTPQEIKALENAAQLKLIDEMLILTGKRSCYSELRFFLNDRKFELENED